MRIEDSDFSKDDNFGSDNSDYINEAPVFEEAEGPDYFSEDDIEEGDIEDDEDRFPISGLLLNLLNMPKPFGYMMPQDKMEWFLKEKGYRIIKKKFENSDEEYSVAIDPNSPVVPEENYSNIREVFDNEVQDIILGWLLKISKENGK